MLLNPVFRTLSAKQEEETICSLQYIGYISANKHNILNIEALQVQLTACRLSEEIWRNNKSL